MAEHAENKFTFELVSPEQKLIDTPAWQVTLPGEEGEIGVRAGHMALLVAMKPGVVQIYREADSDPVRIFIAGGFADIAQEHCTILAEEAFDVANLDPVRLEKELANLDIELGMAETESEKARIQARQLLIQAMLRTVAPAAH